MTPEQERQTFKDFPLVVKGNSKEIRRSGDGECWIKFLPTIYSYTANRAGVVEGSDELRLRTADIFSKVLEEAGIHHAYKGRTENGLYMKSELIEDPPNIETIIKAYQVGTPKHRYKGMDGTTVRESHDLYPEEPIENGGALPKKCVRWDWRNPTEDEDGERLCDEPLCQDRADFYIDTETGKETALQTWGVLHDFLRTVDILLYDICLFITEDGDTVYGEISQDCGRFRRIDEDGLDSLDKDVWRAGGSSDLVLEKWGMLADFVEEAWEHHQSA
jgi:phosphoribosylaminoimidazole-succinocarboxamide synthase